jgi:hypothetical protein
MIISFDGHSEMFGWFSFHRPDKAYIPVGWLRIYNFFERVQRAAYQCTRSLDRRI